MSPAVADASCFMKGGSSPGYGAETGLWHQVANLHEYKRASASALQIEPVARDVCATVGSGRLLAPDGAHVGLQVTCDYSAPGALDAANQASVQLFHFKRTTRNHGGKFGEI